MRAWGFELSFADRFAEFGEEQFKDTIRWNVEQGKRLSGAQISRAEAKRTELLPACSRVSRYLRFLAAANGSSAALLARMGVPDPDQWRGDGNLHRLDDELRLHHGNGYAGDIRTLRLSRTTDLPVGLQIVGAPRADFSVLQLAFALQEATQVYQQKPPICQDRM